MRRKIVVWLIASAAFGPLRAQPLQFEAVSIRPVSPDALKRIKTPADVDKIKPSITPGFVRLPFETLDGLIRRAFNINESRLAAPEWSRHSVWAVAAAIPKGASEKDVPKMLQAMLVSRFGLTYHRETRTREALALTLAKGGIKAPRAEKEEPVKSTYASDKLRTGGTRYEISTTAKKLAEFLQQQLEFEVEDRTGLQGIYRFAWDYFMFGGADPEFRFLNPNPASSYPLNMPAWHDEGLERIGLRLKPASIPLESIVVDRLNRTPSAN